MKTDRLCDEVEIKDLSYGTPVWEAKKAAIAILAMGITKRVRFVHNGRLVLADYPKVMFVSDDPAFCDAVPVSSFTP